MLKGKKAGPHTQYSQNDTPETWSWGRWGLEIPWGKDSVSVVYLFVPLDFSLCISDIFKILYSFCY